MYWYSFLGHEYSFFNVIVCDLIVLKTLKSEEKTLGIHSLKPQKGSAPDTKL